MPVLSVPWSLVIPWRLVCELLLGFDVDHFRAVGLGQFDAEAGGHELRAGLGVDRGIDFEPDGVPLLGLAGLWAGTGSWVRWTRRG